MSLIKCRKCGGPNPEERSDCFYCGENLDEPVPAAAPSHSPAMHNAPGGIAATQQVGMPAAHLGGHYAQSKSRIAAGLLGLFLGFTGVHRFYLGDRARGGVMGGLFLALVASIGWFVFQVLSGKVSAGPQSDGLAAMPLFVNLLMLLLTLWGFIEGWLILACFINSDANGNPLRE